MPPRPPPKHMEWQLRMLPQVITNFLRPFYLRASNNQPGPAPRPQTKPATIQHVPKQTKREALTNASTGTAVGGPSSTSVLKVTDG